MGSSAKEARASKHGNGHNKVPVGHRAEDKNWRTGRGCEICFVCKAMNHYMANCRFYQEAVKRGGRCDAVTNLNSNNTKKKALAL